MSSATSITSLLMAVVRCAANQADVLAVALVGSYAREEARPDSDVDLVIITTAPDRFRQQTQWLQQIDWERIPARVLQWRDADYGAAWSRHIRLSTGPEVELSFGPPEWAASDPIDEGTRQVVMGSCWILFDPAGLLNRLMRALRNGEKCP